MNTRFLEIDSTYRNRKENPLPSNFTVLISQSGTKDINNAYDPICLSSPMKIFNPVLFSGISGTVQATASNTKTAFIVVFPNNTGYPLSHEPDYYVGSIINVSTIGNGIIIDWTYISTAVNDDLFLIGISPLSSAPVGGEIVTFLQSTNVVSANPVFFIEGGRIANNSYTAGCLMYNQRFSCVNNICDYRKIISYDGGTKLAGIDVSTNPIAAWQLTDTYVMRKEIPKLIGQVGVGSTNQKIILPATAPNYQEYYLNNFIRVLQTSNDISTNNIKRIINYDNITNTLTLDSPLSFIPNNSYFEILQFSRDNVVPFTYTGSLVSQQQMVCYEIELVDLVLPNITLKSGGRVAFYPYVYVELQNISGANSGNTHILYSNNPNATRMLFRAPIDDIPNPLISPFIKIDGDGAVQTIKFKPNDSFKFAVYLPNGEPFETLLSEHYSPLPPNTMIQISAEFSMKRL